MTRVVDASVVVAALIDRGPTGQWATSVLLDSELVAPHVMPAEVTDVLRRAVLRGAVDVTSATLAQEDLLELPVAFVPYAPLAERVWELRSTVSSYDAWYVAVAEAMGIELATLDTRLARAPDATCSFATPTE